MQQHKNARNCHPESTLDGEPVLFVPALHTCAAISDICVRLCALEVCGRTHNCSNWPVSHIAARRVATLAISLTCMKSIERKDVSVKSSVISARGLHLKSTASSLKTNKSTLTLLTPIYVLVCLEVARLSELFLARTLIYDNAQSALHLRNAALFMPESPVLTTYVRRSRSLF